MSFYWMSVCCVAYSFFTNAQNSQATQQPATTQVTVSYNCQKMKYFKAKWSKFMETNLLLKIGKRTMNVV